MITEGEVGKYPKDSLRLKLRQITNQAELINSFEMDNDDYKDFCKVNRIKTVAASPMR